MLGICPDACVSSPVLIRRIHVKSRYDARRSRSFEPHYTTKVTTRLSKALTQLIAHLTSAIQNHEYHQSKCPQMPHKDFKASVQQKAIHLMTAAGACWRLTENSHLP